MKIIFILLFLQSTTSSSSVQPCCKGDNILYQKACSGGSAVRLPCEHKFAINELHDLPLRIDNASNLITDSTTIPSERYCQTKFNGTDYYTYLICFDENTEVTDSTLTVHAILELISVAFLLITIVIYIQLPEILDLQGTCILHSLSGLAISFVILSINQLTSTEINKNLCLSYAYVMYFAMMYAFFWLNILAFHIWRTVVRPKIFLGINHWSRIYHAFGIGGPAFLLALLLIAHHSLDDLSDARPGFGETSCWFKSLKSQFIYFYGPMAFLLSLNIVYYSWTIAVLWRNLKESEERKTKVLKYRLVLYVKLFIIMGIPWIFELLSATFATSGSTAEWLWFITDSVNSLQGIIIFLILVVFRKNVIRQMANRNICGMRLPSRWRTVADDECEEMEEEFGLSDTQLPAKA